MTPLNPIDMKPFTPLILTLLFPVFLNAQYSAPTRIFGQGQLDVQAGIGLFPTYIADRPEAIVPPVQLGVRWLLTDNWSIGLSGGYSTSRSREKLATDSIRGRWLNETIFFGLENVFHYTKIDNWDLYGGFSFFYQHVWLDADNPEFWKAMLRTGVKESRGRTSLSTFVGARFALSPNYSVFTELGYGISMLKVGAGYRVR